MTNSADLVQHCLSIIQQAESVQQDIIAALSDGNREQAESLCLQHQQIVESIPLREFSDPLPDDLLAALQRLQAGNDELIRLTTGIQEEIRRQLGEVSLGKRGSQVYHDIDSHQ